MSAQNRERQNRYGYRDIGAAPPAKPTGKRLLQIDIIIDTDGKSNGFEQVKRKCLEKTLIELEGNTHATARALGVSQRTVQNWLKKYDLVSFASAWSREFRK